MPFTPMHKGYKGHQQFDPESNTWHGKIFGIKDVVTFQGTTAHEAWQAFRDSVDDYLEFCKEGDSGETQNRDQYTKKGFDYRRYVNLISSAVPKPIETEEEYGFALKQVRLLAEQESLSQEEVALQNLIALTVKDYEAKGSAA